MAINQHVIKNIKNFPKKTSIKVCRLFESAYLCIRFREKSGCENPDGERRRSLRGFG